MGVKIVRGDGFRKGLNWQVSGKRQEKGGCQLMLWEGFTVVALYILPIFLALVLLGGALVLLSG